MLLSYPSDSGIRAFAFTSEVVESTSSSRFSHTTLDLALWRSIPLRLVQKQTWTQSVQPKQRHLGDLERARLTVSLCSPRTVDPLLNRCQWKTLSLSPKTPGPSPAISFFWSLEYYTPSLLNYWLFWSKWLVIWDGESTPFLATWPNFSTCFWKQSWA